MTVIEKTAEELIAEARAWLLQAAHSVKELRPIMASGWSYVASARLDTAEAKGGASEQISSLRQEAAKIREMCSAMLAVAP